MISNLDSIDNIYVAVADDHTLFRKGLIALVNNFSNSEEEKNFEVTVEAANGDELIADLAKISEEKFPDVLLLDHNMPGIKGVDLIPQLKEIHHDLRVILVSQHTEKPIIIHAMKNGAAGYLVKEAEPEEVNRAISSVRDQGYYFNEILSQALVSDLTKKQSIKKDPSDPNLLKPHELKTLEYLCQGLKAAEIGKKCFLSGRTIENHILTMRQKTNTPTNTGLVAWAFRNGWVE